LRTTLLLRWLTMALLPASPVGSQTNAAPEPPLTVATLFSNPKFSSAALSADGRTLAVIYAQGDKQLIVTRSLQGGELKPIAQAPDPETRLNWLAWANDHRLLVSAQARNPDAVGMRSRVTRLFGVDADGGKFEWLGRRWPRFGQDRLQPFEQDRIVHWTPGDPEHVLVQVDPPYRDEWPRVMRMDVRSGALRPVAPPQRGVLSWYADARGSVRAGAGYVDGRWYELWTRLGGDGPFERVLRQQALAEGPEFLDFHPSANDRIYVRQDHEGRAAVFAFDLRERKLGERVFAHPVVDVDGLQRAAAGDQRVVGVRYTVDRREIRYFDDAAQETYEALKANIGRTEGSVVDVEPVDSSTDGRWQLLRVSSDIVPPAWWVYDREQRKLAQLMEERPGLPRSRLSAMRRIDYKARDGMNIPAYLTLPANGASGPHPMIVLVHGGPWARDAIGWDPEVQLFASRGYAVLQVNFRGSTGLGTAHLQAGYREWGQKIQDDITDGVRWAIDNGYADAGRVGIYGASFGGYAALAGLVRTPGLYRAAAAYAPVTDIEQLLDDDQWYAWGYDWHETLIGGDRERLRANSPLRQVARINAPVLLGHGEDDPRIHVRQSQRMAAALREAGKPVTYLEFPDEVHGFLIERNRLRWYETVASFFDEALRASGAEGQVPGA